MIMTMHSDQNACPPRVEVITSVQRRRRWPTAEKIRLVEETMQPGMSVSYVARRAGVESWSRLSEQILAGVRLPSGEAAA
jgi:transposase